MIKGFWMWFFDRTSQDAPDLAPMPLWLNGLGYGLILLFGLIKLPLYQSSKHLDTLLLVLGLVCILVYGASRVRNTLPLWLILASVLAALATWTAGTISHPDLIKSTPKIEHLATHFLFVVFAFWLMGSVKKTLVLWIVAMISVVLAPWLLGGGWDELARGLEGERIDLGFRNAQHTSVVMGSALLGWLIFAKRMVFGEKHTVLRGVLWFVVLMFLMFYFITSQTRAAYIGAATVLVMFVIGLIIHGINSKQGFWSLFSVILIFLFAVVLIANDTLVKRLPESSATISPVLRGDWNAVPPNSLGLRIHSWRAGFEWITEYPIFGIGRNGGAIVMQNTEWLKPIINDDFGHMHNSAMELLVRYGFFGLGIYLLLILWIVRQSHKAWKKGDIPNDFYIFFCLFFVFYLIVNMFESFIFYTAGIFPFTIAMSGLLGFLWKSKIIRDKISAHKK